MLLPSLEQFKSGLVLICSIQGAVQVHKSKLATSISTSMPSIGNLMADANIQSTIMSENAVKVFASGTTLTDDCWSTAHTNAKDMHAQGECAILVFIHGLSGHQSTSCSSQ